jgi:hypothetical protein
LANECEELEGARWKPKDCFVGVSELLRRCNSSCVVKLTDEAMELLIVAELALELVKERPMPPGLPPRKLARVGATAGCPTVTDDGGCDCGRPSPRAGGSESRHRTLVTDTSSKNGRTRLTFG